MLGSSKRCGVELNTCRPMPPAKMLTIGFIGLVVFDPLGGASRVFSAEPMQFAIAIQGRRVNPAQQTIRTTQGQLIELAFTADELVELHLHGYDQTVTVQPGSVAVMRLHAKIPGRFAIEGHRFGSGTERSRRHLVLLYLEVHPR
jgi:hypothetical protein